MNFYVKRGDTATIRILTGANDPTTFTSLLFTVKESLGDADTSAVLQKANGYGITADAQGVTVALAHDDTKGLDAARMYHYDVQGQDGTRVVTLAQGQLRTSLDVTRELVQSIPIIQTDPVNPATLAAEVALRVSADASLSSAVSLETSERVARDISLTTRVSIEESTRLAQDVSLTNAITTEASTARAAESALSGAVASKADQSALDATNERTAGVQPSQVSVKSAAGQNAFVFLMDGEVIRAYFDKTSDGSLAVNLCDDQGDYKATPLYLDQGGGVNLNGTVNANGRNVLAAIDSKEPVIAAGSALQLLAGNKGLTTRAVGYITAHLAALSSGDSEALGIAYCTDCYNLTGQMNGGLAVWDRATSKWRLADCGVEVTRDPLTFARGVRAAGYTRECDTDNLHATTHIINFQTSGSGGSFSAPYWSSNGWVTGASYEAPGASAITTQSLRGRYRNIMYGHVRIFLNVASSLGSKHGFVAEFGNGFAGALGESLGLIMDPHGLFGLGDIATCSAFAKHSGIATVSPGTSSGVNLTVEVVCTPSGLTVYVDGVQQGSVVATNLPADGESFPFVVRFRSADGTDYRQIVAGDVYACSF